MNRPLPLSELLRQYRTQAHLSQEELAERAGIAARTIGDLETGVSLTPRAITVSLICEALALEPAQREALRSAAGRRGLTVSKELPAAVPLVGRDAELKAALALLRDDAVRLLTITGGPGVGKTALAAAVARELSAEYGSAIRFIDFGNLPDAALVPTKVSLAFGVRDVWADSVIGPIVAALDDRPTLLIADNFERVAAAAPFVAELLAAVPQLKVLVASRRRLRLTLERTLSVDVLPVESSLALLAQRVEPSAPKAALLQQDPEVIELAKALGGVPLAIELTAPLLRGATARELCSRLDRALDVLGSRDRRGTARKGTMRGAIDSSYILLEANEQRLFRRLSVFGGRFTEVGAQQIAGDAATAAEPLQTLREVATLLDHSLVNATNSAEEAEFEMHPLVTEYAREQLERNGERDAAYLRLTEYCFDLATAPASDEPLYESATRQRLSREAAHLDIALGWLKSSGRLAMAFSLALAAAPNWVRRAEGAHGYAWFTALLADPASRSLDDALLADSHWVASGLAKASEQMERGDQHIALALPLKRALGDRAAVASLLDGAGVSAYLKGDYANGRRLCEEGLAIRRELGDGLLIARSLIDLGACAADEGKHAEARQLLEEALVRFRAAGRDTGVSGVLCNLALVALRDGDVARCRLLAEESIELSERIGYVECAKASKIVLSRALLALGHIGPADGLARSVARDRAEPMLLGETARALAAIACARGDHRLASQLLGAASRDPIAVPLAEREEHERLVRSLEAALGPQFRPEFEQGFAKGSAVFDAL